MSNKCVIIGVKYTDRDCKDCGNCEYGHFVDYHTPIDIPFYVCSRKEHDLIQKFNESDNVEEVKD